MLAYECFEQRWRFPKAYHLFYEYFYKAAVGDKRWKESLEEKKPFANANTEAFALMILKNNYHAWMVQAASEYDFENQYSIEMEERKNDDRDQEEEDDFDSSLDVTKKSILDEILYDMEYYMNDEAQGGNGGDNQSDDENNTHGQDWHMGASSSWTIVTHKDPGRYLKAWKFTKMCLQRVRKNISESDLKRYASGVEDLQRLETTTGHLADGAVVVTPTTTQRLNNSRRALMVGLLGGNVGDANVDALVERRVTTPQVRKRRKILKDLKCFTKKGDDKNVKQRGWTCEGYNYQVGLMRQIKEDEATDQQFVDLYRGLAENITTLMAEIDKQNKQAKNLPDRNEVWELE